MKRHPAIRNLVVAGAVFCFPRPFPAEPAVPQDYVIRSEVRLVLLDVSVTDRAGGFVSGLSQDNFHVFENDAAQPITVFANKDVPVTVGMLVDESQSMADKRTEVILAAESFIAESNPQDEIFVLNFNDRVRRGLPEGIPFSDSIDQLRAALERGVPVGRTALNDAVIDGLHQLEWGRRDKKTLVVISDGGDNASRHTRLEMFQKVASSLATIYTIGLFDLGDQDRNPGILKQLSRISGGEAYFPPSADGMGAICHRIAQEIRTRYTIGYVPPAGNNSGLARRIRVSVAAEGRAGLIARTRTTYRYENPNTDN